MLFIWGRSRKTNWSASFGNIRPRIVMSCAVGVKVDAQGTRPRGKSFLSSRFMRRLQNRLRGSFPARISDLSSRSSATMSNPRKWLPKIRHRTFGLEHLVISLHTPSSLNPSQKAIGSDSNQQLILNSSVNFKMQRLTISCLTAFILQ